MYKRQGWESLADFLNNYTWDDTEILYQIADNCGMIVADWIEREVEDGRDVYKRQQCWLL